MSTVRLTRDLIAMGYTHNELSRQRRTGELVQLRRGAYDAAAPEGTGQAERHKRVIEATVRLASSEAVVSHLSAAVLHGLPVVDDQLQRVQLTRNDVPGGKKRPNLQLYAAPLADRDLVEVNGIRTTSPARTVVDLARSLSFARAVVPGDAALRRGVPREDLERCLEDSRGRPGIAKARRVVAFLDGASESPGESMSRVVLQQAGLPAPALQRTIVDGSGRLIGRVDFCWEEQRTIGEFDGRIKYGRLLKPGETSQDVIYREKLREDALRDLGWQIVRWIWEDLKTPAIIADRLNRAFLRATRTSR